MSLHNLAKHVQRKGRGQDKMLVHMTPEEVHGLQRLALAHGGSLTINPETGLPEAGFLMKILPIVAAAAATYFTAGAAAPALEAALAGTAGAGMGGALAGAGAGALVGGTSAAIQGQDVGKSALMGGLGGAIAGGMGAYDSVYSGVNAGAQLPGTSVDPNGLPINPTASTDAIKQATLDPNAGLSGTIPGMPTPTPPPTQAGLEAAAQSGQARIDALNKLAEAQGAGVTSSAYGSTPGVNAEQSLYQAQGATKLSPEGNIYPDLKATPPPPGSAPSYYSTMSTPGKMFTQTLPGIGASFGDKPDALPGEAPYTSSATLSPDFKGYEPERPNPYYRPQYTRYAADGGLMALAPGGMAEEKKKKQRASLTADRTMAAMGADQAGLAMLNNARYGANMTGASPLQAGITSLGDLPNAIGAARGGLADLGGYSDGGRLLKGPGDGMSDNIPAQIGRKQPARLADGEFVVPADVVSHLGNGSTDAGAKRLYAMMDRARQARTGKKKQAPAVNAQRMMPA